MLHRRWWRRQPGAICDCDSSTTPRTISPSGLDSLAATQWQEVHAYFMHEPTAPGYAATLLRLHSALQQA